MSRHELSECGGPCGFQCVRWGCPYCNDDNDQWHSFHDHGDDLKEFIDFHWEDHHGDIHVIGIEPIRVGGMWLGYFVTGCTKCNMTWIWRPMKDVHCSNCGADYRMLLPLNCSRKTTFRTEVYPTASPEKSQAVQKRNPAGT